PHEQDHQQCPCRQVESGTRARNGIHARPMNSQPRLATFAFCRQGCPFQSNNRSCGNQPAHIRLDRASLTRPTGKAQQQGNKGRLPTPSQAAGPPMPNLTKRTTYQVSDAATLALNSTRPSTDSPRPPRVCTLSATATWLCRSGSAARPPRWVNEAATRPDTLTCRI